jgi:hypothetical protein
MKKPVRLRLSRRSGSDLQKLSRQANGLDAIVVARPSRWGNPYPLTEYGRAKSITLYRKDLTRKLAKDSKLLEPLRGKNLACWCAPDVACHADVLLEFANA